MHSLEEAGDEPAISVRGLVKTFGEVRALDGIDLEVARGTVLGILGPNGAGKTTTVRILADAAQARRGQRPRRRARRRPRRRRAARPDRPRRPVRRRRRAPDRRREPRDGRPPLRHEPPRRHQRAPRELLERFDLTEAAERVAKTYSGGMRRRLDLAAALVAKPPVLFLDEPTTGLDPRSRVELWETIEDLVADGTTVLLTTQYLDEAERLADRIAVIDRGTRDRRRHGRRAQGAASAASGSRCTCRTPRRPSRRPRRSRRCPASRRRSTRRPCACRSSSTTARSWRRSAVSTRPASASRTSASRRPTLDDVFLALTGHGAVDAQDESDELEEVAA